MSDLEKRFWSKVRIRSDPSQCWVWIATRLSRDYGQFWLDKKPRKAHRVAWELTRGPVPDGLCVLHRCDNPPCVNPAHLFVGTKMDNMRDMWAKGRGFAQRMGEDGLKPRLTDDDVRVIRADPRPHKEIAVDYGLGRSTISAIKCRRTWGHV